MLVRMPQTLYVTEHFQLGRFGQVADVVGRPARSSRPTSSRRAPPAIALQAANDLNRLIVDDALQTQNPDPILFGRGGKPLTASNTLRGGDTATGMVGVLTYTWAGNAASGNAYRLRPVGALGGGVPRFVSGQPAARAAPPAVGGSLKVVGMNLLNYFNTFGTTGCSLRRRWSRGRMPRRQRRRRVRAPVAEDGQGDHRHGRRRDRDHRDRERRLRPDSAIPFLVDGLNEARAPGTYAYVDVDAGTGQVNAARQRRDQGGLLYKPATVTPVGQTAALNCVAFVNGGDAARGTGRRSRRRSRRTTGGRSRQRQPPQEQGQRLRRAGHRRRPGQLRRRSHERRRSRLPTGSTAIPTGAGSRTCCIVGDLNSYAKEDPIVALEAHGFTNLDRVPHRVGRVLVRVRRAVGLPRPRARARRPVSR